MEIIPHYFKYLTTDSMEDVILELFVTYRILFCKEFPQIAVRICPEYSWMLNGGGTEIWILLPLALLCAKKSND